MDPTALNSGDTAWMFTSTALVMLNDHSRRSIVSTGDLAKKENVLNTLFMSLIAFCNYKSYMGYICISTCIWN